MVQDPHPPRQFLDEDDDDFDEDPGSDVEVCIDFEPSDRELVGFYLHRKESGEIPPSYDFIPTMDIYVPGAEPWFIHPGSLVVPSSSSGQHFSVPRHRTGWFYCYTRTTPSGHGSSRKVGSGTWHGNGKPTTIRHPRGETLGYKTTFSFMLPSDTGDGNKSVRTSWVMHEFSLSKKKGNDVVLCRIRSTKHQPGKEESSLSSLTRCKRQRTTMDISQSSSYINMQEPWGNCRVPPPLSVERPEPMESVEQGPSGGCNDHPSVSVRGAPSSVSIRGGTTAIRLINQRTGAPRLR